MTRRTFLGRALGLAALPLVMRFRARSAVTMAIDYAVMELGVYRVLVPALNTSRSYRRLWVEDTAAERLLEAMEVHLIESDHDEATFRKEVRRRVN